MDRRKTAALTCRRRAVAFFIVFSAVIVAILVLGQMSIIASGQYPLDRLVRRFGQVRGGRLQWDYEAIRTAYQECNDAIYQQQLLDLMVASRGVHLVPELIDSIGPGGSMDTERKILAVIRLTGHDFTREFDITSIAGIHDANEVKTRLRAWWAGNGQKTIAARGPSQAVSPPNDWPSLALTLATEKSRYLELEPVRLTVVVEERGGSWHTLYYRPRKPAFKLEFFRVGNGGERTRIAQTRYPDQWRHCGIAGRWFARPGYLVIDPCSPHVTQHWVNVGLENLLEAGGVTLQVELTPLYGRHRGRQLRSSEVRIEVVKPQGQDVVAHQFLTGTQPAEGEDEHGVRPEFVRLYGLVWTSNSSHDSDFDDYFVKAYGRSIYAHYVRFTQARSARRRLDFARNSYPPDGTYSDVDARLAVRLKEIIADAPRDFPLLADAYVALLDYYRTTGELEKMATVAQTVEPTGLVTVDPRLPEQLAALREYPGRIVADVLQKNRFGRTSLHEAVENGPPALVLFLLSNGADVNADADLGTPLWIAAKAGRNQIVELLIDHGANVDAKHDGLTPLFWPVWNGRIDIVKLLMARGAEVNVADHSGRTPFERAVANNRLEIARLLAASRGEGGKTPLHWAVEHGRQLMVHNLLKNGARVGVKDDAGRTPLDIAQALADNDRRAKTILLLLEEHLAAE